MEHAHATAATPDYPAVARARAQTWIDDDALARSKGSAPQQVEARKRMAAMFCDIHFPGETPEIRAARLASIDYSMPLFTVNARTLDLQNPKAKGFLGMGRKPSYLLSSALPPKNPSDPIYALEYYTLKA